MSSRSTFGASLLCGAAAMALAAGAARAETPGGITISPQPLASALGDFAAKTHRAILVTPDLTAKKTTAGVAGAADAETALAQVLAGTGLTYKHDGATFLIVTEGESEGGNVVQELVVTAQKKEEAIQTVPIAISAFTQKSLEEQHIEGGFDLLKAVPNVTFSKNNFSGYNFSIRGIGTKAISVTTDPGVAVEFNNMALIRNRLFEQEYFDVERVEVLRGPQGTLHGRNATSGVINMISAKPNLGEFEGSIKGEVGNYHSKRITGMINVPLISDKLAVRFAGALTQREGYGVDLYDNTDVDGRDLWSARLTVAFKPVERLRTNFVWERFNEDDNRARTSKQLCTRDPGPTEVGGVPIPHPVTNPTKWGDGDFALSQAFFSQGCLPGSLYDKAALGTPNGITIPFITFLEAATFGYIDYDNCGGFCNLILRGTDPYGRQMQSPDLRSIYSMIKPKYRASADTFEFNADFDLTPALTLSSQTVYVRDKYYATQDYNRFTTLPTFFNTSILPDNLPSRVRAPNGVFCDPQLGCSNTIVGQDLSRAGSNQFSQEFRIQSNFDGSLNFSAGIHYTHYRTTEDYYVFFNGITYAASVLNRFVVVGGRDPSKLTTNPDCSATFDYGGGIVVPDGLICIPVEQNSIANIQDVGHNYFLSRNPYSLRSAAAFGELYWQATDTLKVTVGLRYTDDKKTFTPVPSETILTDSARLAPYVPFVGQEFVDSLGALAQYSFGHGFYPALPPIKRNWKEVTGRAGVDWRPHLSFTDQTMIYGFYSRGYKGGGMNPPRIGLDYEALEKNGIILAPSAPPEFEPEFVNAFELGAKNTLLSGALMLNADAFFYDYSGYQVSKIVDRTANNENFDAKVWGFELETLFAPTRHLRLNASLGYLDTSLGEGSKSIDVMNRTAGHTDWVVVKPTVTLTSNCIVPVSVASQVLGATGIGEVSVSYACPGGGLFGGTFTGRGSALEGPHTLPDGTTYDPADHPEANYGAGFYTDVSHHELPNSPHWTVTMGAQYSIDFLEDWKATLRADAYWQAQSWARIYELPIDKLHGWYNANLSLWIERPKDGLKIEVYAKNVLNKTPITDAFINSDDTALTTNVFVLDPRLIGVSITKKF